MQTTPSASYSLTLRVKLSSRAGTLGQVATAIGRAGGDIGAIDIVSASSDCIIRDITVNAASSEHGEKIIDAVRDIDGIEVVNVSDLTFLMHLGGKIEVVSKMPLKTRADLSMAYTPGVARVCEAIRDDPEKVFTLTIKKNTVAVVTDLANCWQEDGGDESCCEWSRRCWCRMFKDHHGSGREERNRL